MRAELLHSNQGWQDHKAAFRIRLTSASGEQSTCQGALPDDSWQRAMEETAQQVNLDMGRVHAALGARQQTLKIRCAELSGTLDFKNLSPAWQPGDGELFSTSDSRRRRISLPNPRAQVEGRLETKSASIRFTGLGWVMHQRSAQAAHLLWRRRLVVHASEAEASLHCELLDLGTAPSEGRHGWCVLAGDRGLRLGSSRLAWHLSAFLRDEAMGPEALLPRIARAAVAQGLSLEPQGLKGAEVEIRLGILKRRFDPSDALGPLMAGISRSLNSAMDYEFDCVSKIQLEGDDAPRIFHLPGQCSVGLNGL